MLLFRGRQTERERRMCMVVV